MTYSSARPPRTYRVEALWNGDLILKAKDPDDAVWRRVYAETTRELGPTELLAHEAAVFRYLDRQLDQHAAERRRLD